MSTANPFSLSFGKEPVSLIRRELLNSEITENFSDSNPTYQVCMLTGVRGSGKTVAMTTISNDFRKRDDWIVMDLNPERDILNMLTAEISNRKELFELFRDAKINLSVLGFGPEIDGVPPITDIVVALRRMLEKLTKAGKKVLITIDEVSNTKQFREFANQFQIFVRENLNIFLIMTGLYENIYEIQNEKSLTFLYRAPRIDLKPLSRTLMAAKYKEVFHLKDEEATAMADVTKGYSFAFQLLGYLCWSRDKKWQDVLTEFDGYLEEFSYKKIRSELSATDKNVILAFGKKSEEKVETLRAALKIATNEFSVYRQRLIRKGLAVSSSYGVLELALPRFIEFAGRMFV